MLSKLWKAITGQSSPIPPPQTEQVRINTLARELEVKAKSIIDLLPQAGVTEKKTHSSSLDLAAAEKVRDFFRKGVEARCVPENSNPSPIEGINTPQPAALTQPHTGYSVPATSSIAKETVKVGAVTDNAGARSGSTSKLSERSPLPSTNGSQQVSKKRNREASKAKRDAEQKRKEFRHLLPNLIFNESALERLISLENHQQVLALEQFKQLDSGNRGAKHHVPGTHPKIFQRDAGSNVRIYYRQEGAANRIRVFLIGTKKSQDSDYAAMHAES